MLLAFWKNPEFVRHRRADLRPFRAVAILAIVSVVCWLTGLSVWNGSEPRHEHFYQDFYLALMVMQCGALVFWVFIACTQSVVKERDQKTYDFLRTTRLSTMELMVGKLFGTPVAGYFAFLCFLPVTVTIGILAHTRIVELFFTFVIVVVFALVTGLAAMVLSMKAEKSSAGLALLGIFLLYSVALTGASSEPQERDLMPGTAALSPLMAIRALHEHAGATSAPFFGAKVPLVALNLALYGMFGAWLVLMLWRNLKTDFDEILLLNRWQLLGLVAFVNCLFYGFLNLQGYWGYTPLTAIDIASIAVGMNLAGVAIVGLLTITPKLYFRKWYKRNREGLEGYLSENGPPWPWLLMACLLGYMFLTVASMGYSGTFPMKEWKMGQVAGWMLFGAVYILRDILFLQWLSLTNMKRAAVKGVLLISLYYAAVGIMVSAFTDGTEKGAGMTVLALLTPFELMSDKLATWSVPNIAGMVIQIAVSGAILYLINERLARKAVSPPIATEA